MEPRTVGVEEELLLVDPDTRAVAPRSAQVLGHVETDGELGRELYRHQLETRTPPTADLGDLREHLVAARRHAAEGAAAEGLATAASGTGPLEPTDDERITRDDRYLAMAETYGEVARAGVTCGMHVHTAIDSAEEGVAVIDRIAPWLPVVLAISANSPYHHGQDSGHASWRSQLWARWPSAGPTAPFGSAAGYRDVARRLVASGVALDEGMLYFDARLSRDQPTVEVRVSDVCTDVDDAVLVAALVRALVLAAVTGPIAPSWRPELLRAAQWRAARFGLSDRLLDPVTGEPTSARDVLDRLYDALRDPLDACGDAALVTDGLRRVLAGGGAARQRAAYERSGGLAAVVDDLVARTNRNG